MRRPRSKIKMFWRFAKPFDDHLFRLAVILSSDWMAVVEPLLSALCRFRRPRPTAVASGTSVTDPNIHLARRIPRPWGPVRPYGEKNASARRWFTLRDGFVIGGKFPARWHPDSAT